MTTTTHAWHNIRDYGAVGDGETDDTDAIRAAIDAAAEGDGGVVYVPPGRFLSGEVTLKHHVCLQGDPAWSYREEGGSILQLNDPNAKCLVDTSTALGTRINGMTLHGGSLGEGVVGVLQDKSRWESETIPRGCATPILERTAVRGFTGDGVYFSVGVSAIRQCGISRNAGHAIHYERGADCFISDNIIWGNGGAGFYACTGSGNTTLIGNRIEWNRGGGIVAQNAWHYTISGNSFDHNFNAPNIWLKDNCHDMVITGNDLLRGGVFRDDAVLEDAPYLSANLRIENARGVTVTGNGIQSEPVGGPKHRKDSDPVYPHFGIVIRALDVATITSNHLAHGGVKDLIVDLGEHADAEQVIVHSNPGRRHPG